MTRLAIASALLATLLAAPSPAAPPAADFVRATPVEPLPAPAAAAVSAVDARPLAVHLALLASPALEGRGLGSKGLDAALDYVAARLALSGVPPLRPAAGEKGALAPYFQAVPVREVREPGGAVEVEAASGGSVRRAVFVHGVDALLPALSARSVTAPAVFAGYGIREKAPARDDYQGLDAKGKVVVLLEGVPPGEAWKTKELLERWAPKDADERWREKVETARALGAVAVVGVEGEAWGTRLLGKEKPYPYAFGGLDEDRAETEPLLARVSPACGEALLGPAAGARPRPLPGVTVTLRVTGRESLVASRNVVAVLEGSDPELKRQAVVLGAHVDHLGVVDGTVRPGADDNASGTAALLEIARALAAAPVRPRRTLLFAFWTGEEEDKIGSSHWVRHPLWPLERTTAYLNLDMIGHPWTREEIATLVEESHLPDGTAFLDGLAPADFVEPGVASFAPDLGPLLARAGRGTGLALHLDWTDGRHGGSDYRPFARARVPFVRFFGSFFPGYHRAADTAEALDAAQVQRVARLALATAWLVADR